MPGARRINNFVQIYEKKKLANCTTQITSILKLPVTFLTTGAQMLVSPWLLKRERVAVLCGEGAREEETGTHVL